MIDPGLSGKAQDGGVNARRFDDAAPGGDVAEKHGQTAVFGIGVGQIANAALFAVQIGRVIRVTLRTHEQAAFAARRAERPFSGCFGGRIPTNVILAEVSAGIKKSGKKDVALIVSRKIGRASCRERV